MEYDLIIVGAGPAGMMAAIVAARAGRSVLVLEKMPSPGRKLRATGGGRCNVTNTLDRAAFIARVGRGGRFMTPALARFDPEALRAFLAALGVATHAPDGFHVFPVGHVAESILTALTAELARLNVTVATGRRVERLLTVSGRLSGVATSGEEFFASSVVIATGGLGYPELGAEGDGYALARAAGHTITDLAPGLVPLHTRESWVANCRADTIGKATLRIDLPEARKLRATGDLIFGTDGIRGPVVLDFAREVTPLLRTRREVPLLVNLTKGLNEDEVRRFLIESGRVDPPRTTCELLGPLMPGPLARELCLLADVDPALSLRRASGAHRDRLVKLLAWTPLTIIGHEGFARAMITRGGISLKEVRPETLESRLCPGLFFCGEILDLDGPCGGFNLQWAFSSGFLAGSLGVGDVPRPRRGGQREPVVVERS